MKEKLDELVSAFDFNYFVPYAKKIVQKNIRYQNEYSDLITNTLLRCYANVENNNEKFDKVLSGGDEDFKKYFVKAMYNEKNWNNSAHNRVNFTPVKSHSMDEFFKPEYEDYHFQFADEHSLLEIEVYAENTNVATKAATLDFLKNNSDPHQTIKYYQILEIVKTYHGADQMLFKLYFIERHKCTIIQKIVKEKVGVTIPMPNLYSMIKQLRNRLLTDFQCLQISSTF